MKIAVYTCITAGYDNITVPIQINDQIDYLCFNDGTVKPLFPWVDIKVDDNLDKKDINRYLKLAPHLNSLLSSYDLTIYIDGSIRILSNLNTLIDFVKKSPSDIFMYSHPFRNCVFQECKECFFSGKISLESYNQIVGYLKEIDMPKEYGLFEATIIIRKKFNNALQNLMNAWWNNYCNSFGAKRDQIALMVSLFRLQTGVTSLGLPDYHFKNEHFISQGFHRNKRVEALYSWWIKRSFLKLLSKFNIIKLAKF
jgi:hypothetical protein